MKACNGIAVGPFPLHLDERIKNFYEISPTAGTFVSLESRFLSTKGSDIKQNCGGLVSGD